jgi:SH3 domain
MKRVQNHFGIASSSVAQSDIDDREYERIEEWVAETETVVEEEEPPDTARENNQQTKPSISKHPQSKKSRESTGPSFRGSPSPVPNGSTTDVGNEAGAAHGTVDIMKDEVTAQYTFDAERPGDLAFKKGEVITVTSRSSSTHDWWTGRIGDRTGVFPANYLEVPTLRGVNRNGYQSRQTLTIS